jgi:hypothetical protein
MNQLHLLMKNGKLLTIIKWFILDKYLNHLELQYLYSLMLSTE